MKTLVFTTLLLLSPHVSADELGGLLPNESYYEGLGFGIGLALTFKKSGAKDRIDEATVENGIVRIKKEMNRDPKIMLESHYFFEPMPLKKNM